MAGIRREETSGCLEFIGPVFLDRLGREIANTNGKFDFGERGEVADDELAGLGSGGRVGKGKGAGEVGADRDERGAKKKRGEGDLFHTR
ncbi:MAG: hypothetical protein WDN28_32565 [Chthoniobacter sp.]